MTAAVVVAASCVVMSYGPYYNETHWMVVVKDMVMYLVTPEKEVKGGPPAQSTIKSETEVLTHCFCLQEQSKRACRPECHKEKRYLQTVGQVDTSRSCRPPATPPGAVI